MSPSVTYGQTSDSVSSVSTTFITFASRAALQRMRGGGGGWWRRAGDDEGCEEALSPSSLMTVPGPPVVHCLNPRTDENTPTLMAYFPADRITQRNEGGRRGGGEEEGRRKGGGRKEGRREEEGRRKGGWRAVGSPNRSSSRGAILTH